MKLSVGTIRQDGDDITNKDDGPTPGQGMQRIKGKGKMESMGETLVHHIQNGYNKNNK